MKRIIAVLLCFIMCLGVVGCNTSSPQGGTEEEKTEVTTKAPTTEQITTAQPTTVQRTTDPTTAEPETAPQGETITKTFKEMSFKCNSAYDYDETDTALTINIRKGDLIQIVALSYTNDNPDFESNFLGLPISGVVSMFDDVQERIDENTTINGRNAKATSFLGKLEGTYIYVAVISLIGTDYMYGISYMCSVDQLSGNNSNIFYDLIESIEFEAPEPEEEETTQKPTEKTDEKPTKKAESNDEDGDKETVSQSNAVRSAKKYLNVMAFSEEGLIKQLEYEGYSYEDAAYGVSKSGADWMEQAEKKAERYLDVMSFSRQGLIDQLEYEGFTPEQAEHGADFVGL